jgi:hypothetical protein
MQNNSQTISTVAVLTLIHRGSSKLQVKNDPDLAMLVETAVSILSLHLRKPFVFVKPEQASAIQALEDYLK